jgi:hypothetical protein
MTTHPYGYDGARLALDEMRTRSSAATIDPELWRRLAAMMTAAAAAGVTLGIGGSWRPNDRQLAGFLDRHDVVASGGCCSYNGRRYALKAGRAHMAPPGLSYHEATTPLGHCLAVDMISSDGHRWMNANCARFGLRHFANVNNEPWHVQPNDVPTGRGSYRAASHHPLKAFVLPGSTAAPAPTTAPVRTLRIGMTGEDVRALQRRLTALGFSPGGADGAFGPRTDAAVKAFQTTRKLSADGVVGPLTQKELVR